MLELLEAQKSYPEDMRIDLFFVNDGHRRPLNSADGWSENDNIELVAPELSRHRIREKSDIIVKGYYSSIRSAQNDEQKIRCIAKCAQQLEQSHLFMDGNARTFGFLMVNKLLLENQMVPTMIANPNRFDGCSIDELSQDIRQGQSMFEHYSSSMSR